MRTRTWLFPGIAALLALLLGVLALSLLWGTLAGAATALSDGVVTTDREFVSPDSTNIASADRAVGVTLTNLDLNIAQYVGTGPGGETTSLDLDNNGEFDNDDVVLIRMDGFVFQGDTFRVRLDDGAIPDHPYTIIIAAIPAGALTTADQLPMVGSDGVSAATVADVRIVNEEDAIAGVDIGPDEVSVSSLLDAPNGRIVFRADTDINAGETFGIRFVTSAQETALVNVKGDAANFDLLLVEDPAGPAGEYDASFVVADSIIIDMGLAAGTSALNTITHEQHDVPAALRGNVLFVDEPQTSGTDIFTGGATFDITLDNPPIRVDTRAVAITDEPTGVDLSVVAVLDATTGLVRVRYDGSSTNALGADDEFRLTYRGSDSVTLTVDFAPIQASGITEFVVPSDKDEPLLAFGDFFTLISTNNATGEVRIGVIVGSGDDDDVEGQGQADLPGHITVLGVSYSGSETIEIPAGGVAQGNNFSVVVEFPTEDANGDGQANAADVEIISIAGLTAGNAMVIAVDGSMITFSSDGAADLVAGDTFTIAYAFSAGADPRNALLPFEPERPVILVVPGSRATIASGNDKVTVDAETDPPLFANPSPFDGSSTSDPSQTISIDITDALAGVDPDSIVFVFSDDSGDPATELVDANRFGDDDETVSISIDGDVVTASVGLDDVDTALTSLAIDANGTTAIWWWVEASDNPTTAALRMQCPMTTVIPRLRASRPSCSGSTPKLPNWSGASPATTGTPTRNVSRGTGESG